MYLMDNYSYKICIYNSKLVDRTVSKYESMVVRSFFKECSDDSMFKRGVIRGKSIGERIL